MKKQIYDAVYRLFYNGDYRLTINVGGISLSLYDPEKNDETPNVWNDGVVANGDVYKVADLWADGKGPGTKAELFMGTYDIIDGLAEQIFEDNFKED
ncbi:hypothetical protein [Fibrobacter sp.]|uniref:hypothetical protein n=1 Tax=Fibrobacter sp. TaxID=35828 RepID=UPI00386ED6F8